MCGDIDGAATFEVLRKAVSKSRRAQGRDQRYVHWVGDSRKLAYARDHRGRLELFISEDSLESHVDSVARRLDLNVWRSDPVGFCVRIESCFQLGTTWTRCLPQFWSNF